MLLMSCTITFVFEYFKAKTRNMLRFRHSLEAYKYGRRLPGRRWRSGKVKFGGPRSEAIFEVETVDFREKFAPWVLIGEYQKDLMSHLETQELLRAAFVLHLCHYDTFVNRSRQLFQISQKFGKLSKWFLKKTFFNQFVGGETLEQMKKTMESFHKRGIKLMLLPVIEGDVVETASNSNQLDQNLETLQELVRLTAALEPINPVFQLKVSAIIPTNTLESISTAILEYHSKANGDFLINQARLVTAFANSLENSNSLSSISLDNIETEKMVIGLQRADALAKLAKKLSVRILVDAEFVSCKQAISLVAHSLMARHNRHTPLIGNTIQTYLKTALLNATQEWDLMNMIGVHWSGKIVRGAYIDREIQFAKMNGFPSPIWNSYYETNRSYNLTIAHLLEKLVTRGDTISQLTLATHNEGSIRLACHFMKEFGIDSQKNVSFAQIYGMADYLTTPLIKSNYKVYKSTPFGPMKSVLPYLSRRAVENRSVIQGARQERSMLNREIQTRLVSAFQKRII